MPGKWRMKREEYCQARRLLSKLPDSQTSKLLLNERTKLITNPAPKPQGMKASPTGGGREGARQKLTNLKTNQLKN